MKNKAGNFVAPTLASTSAAGEGVTVPGEPRHQSHQLPGAQAYPITSQTFIVVNKDLCKAGVPGGEAAAKGVVKFLDYGLGAGQAILAQADYAALPAAILAKSKEAVGGPAVQRLAAQRLSDDRADAMRHAIGKQGRGGSIDSRRRALDSRALAAARVCPTAR